MSQRLEAAEALLATIATARARMEHLAHAHLSFERALQLELVARVGHSPERLEVELIEDIVDRRVDSWRRARAAIVATYAEAPSLPPRALPPMDEAADEAVEDEELAQPEEIPAAAEEAPAEEAFPVEEASEAEAPPLDLADDEAPLADDEEQDAPVEDEEAEEAPPPATDEVPDTDEGPLPTAASAPSTDDLAQGYGAAAASLSEAGVMGEEPTVIAEVPPEIAALRGLIFEDEEDSSAGEPDHDFQPGPDFDDANDEPSDRFDSAGHDSFEDLDVDSLESLSTGDHEPLGALEVEPVEDDRAWPDEEDTDQGPLSLDPGAAQELLSADLAPIDENDLDMVVPEPLDDGIADPAAGDDPSLVPLDDASLQPLTEPEDEATAIASAEELEAALRGDLSSSQGDSMAGVSAPRSVGPSLGGPRVQLGGPRAVAPASSQGPVVVEPESDFGEKRPVAASIQLLGDGKARVLTDTLALGDADGGEEDVSDPHVPETAGSSFSVSLEAPEEPAEEDQVHIPVLSEDDADAALSSVLQEPGQVRAAGQNQVDLAEFKTRATQAEARGDLQEAITHYGDLLDLDPDLTEAYLARGRCLLELGDYAASMSDFQRAEDLAPDSADPLLEMGNLFYARKDYQRAIHYYDQAIELDPTHAMARCRRGICYYHRKEYEPALADLQRAYALDPDIHNIGRYVQMAVKAMRRTGR